MAALPIWVDSVETKIEEDDGLKGIVVKGYVSYEKQGPLKLMLTILMKFDSNYEF